jgi:hypothetical protein
MKSRIWTGIIILVGLVVLMLLGSGCARSYEVKHPPADSSCDKFGMVVQQQCYLALPSEKPFCIQAGKIGIEACDKNLLDQFVPMIQSDLCGGMAVAVGSVVFTACEDSSRGRDCRAVGQKVVQTTYSSCILHKQQVGTDI